MHKKGIMEEAADKCSRRTVKQQHGIVGVDMSAVIAQRNQMSQRRGERLAVIEKVKLIFSL